MLCTFVKGFSLYWLVKINIPHMIREYSTSSRQTGNAMKKIMGSSRKKKFHFCETPGMPAPSIFSKGSFEGKQSGNSRRASVLNKLFMRHITDQMATGECSSLILGHGIEVNRVKVTPNYKILRVYWTAKSTGNVEIILQKCAGKLRHELSQLRLMGVVPLIQFVKDKHYETIIELDNRLNIADFGQDHIPLNITEKYKSQFELSTPLDNKIKERLKELDGQESEVVEDAPLPPMPQNVFGIPHADILDKIKKSINKTKALHRHAEGQSIDENQLVHTLNMDPVCLGDSKSQRIAFREFLHKRELLRLKAKCENRYGKPELEYLEEGNENQLNFSNEIEQYEEDFIDEDIEEKN